MKAPSSVVKGRNRKVAYDCTRLLGDLIGAFKTAAEASNAEQVLLLSGFETNGLFRAYFICTCGERAKRNGEPSMVQSWVSLISPFTLCFAALVSTILLCIFKSNCYSPQHLADTNMQSRTEQTFFVKIDTDKCYAALARHLIETGYPVTDLCWLIIKNKYL